MFLFFPPEVPSLKLTATEVVGKMRDVEAIQGGLDAVFVRVTIIG